LIAEAAAAMEFGASSEDIARFKSTSALGSLGISVFFVLVLDRSAGESSTSTRTISLTTSTNRDRIQSRMLSKPSLPLVALLT